MALFNDYEKQQIKQGLAYSGIGSAFDLGQSFLGNLIGMPFEIAREKRNYALQYQYNEQAAENAFRRQLEFWNTQNLYNDPSSQVARLLKAGLNPALMNGGVQHNTAGGLSSVSAGSVSNSSSTQPVTKLMSFVQMAMMLKESNLLDAQTQDLIQAAANKEIDTIIKSILGKDQWLQVKDKARTMGYSLDSDFYDSFFGIGTNPSSDGISPSKASVENIQSSTALNRSLTSLNDAERITVESLRDNHEALMQAQTAAYQIANDLERRFGPLQRNSQLMISKAEYEKLRQEVQHENLLIPVKRKLLNAQVDEATASAFLTLIEKQFNETDYEYLKSWVGNESNWYDLIGRIIYELTTDVPFSAGVKIGNSKK